MIYDPKKRRANRRKHKVDLEDGHAAFDAPMLTREDDRLTYGEHRFISLGCAKGQVVVLVWTEQGDEPRLISYREAEPHEKEAYYRAFPRL